MARTFASILLRWRKGIALAAPAAERARLFGVAPNIFGLSLGEDDYAVGVTADDIARVDDHAAADDRTVEPARAILG